MSLLQLKNIHKSFGPVKALQGVDLEVREGEVHGLIGENGAGKSTLMKVLSGAHFPDQGEMTFDGNPYQPETPMDARQQGIAMIYQELNLAMHLTVEENIMLGIEDSRFGFIKRKTKEVSEALAWLGQEGIHPDTPVNQLSLGKQQLIEIARAIILKAKLVIMDEPTSSLTAEDTKALFQVIRRFKERNIAVIYISHFLEEAKALCDRFTVLRDGQTVASGNMVDTNIPKIIEHMVGRTVDELYPRLPHEIGEAVLEVQGLQDDYLNNISFKLRKGEILGLSGLVGAGRSETIRSIFGLEKVENGTVKIKGYPEIKATYLNPHTALKKGLNLLSENRKEEGLALNLPIFANITFSALKRYSKAGIVNLKNEYAQASKWVERLNIKCHDAAQDAGTLSGGNQQKICLARMLHHDSDILFLDEPTRGIDVGSKAEIYRLIHTLAAQGKAIVVVSSYLPELLGICDSIAVMSRGKISPVKPVAEWKEEDIMLFATSGG
jgi:ribose transport system ATP-binding protein